MDWELVAVIGLGVLLVIGISLTSAMKQMGRTAGGTKVDEARSILENRYALGELDEEEFGHRLEVLSEERRRYRKRLYQHSD